MNATATAAQPRAPIPQATITVTRAGSRSIDRIAHRRAAGQVALFEGISLEVVELDHAWAICRVARGVGAKDRAHLDVRRDLDRESRLEVADELVPVRADAAHRVVVAVKGLLGEDRLPPPLEQGSALNAGWNRDAARLEKRGQNVDVAHQLGV